MPMITSKQVSSKAGGVTVEVGPYPVDNLVILSAFDHREGLVWSHSANLVNRQCHHFDVKGSSFGSLG